MKSCLYSNISDKVLFSRVGFYKDDIDALKKISSSVISTNSLFEIVMFRPNLLVSYFYSRSLFAAIIGRVIGSKVIFTGGADQISPKLLTGWRLKMRKLTAFACLVVSHRIFLACTDDYENFLLLCGIFKSLRSKITLVNHVVNPASFDLPPIKLKSRRFSAFTICWMGSIENVQRKGVDRAIYLISILRSLGLDASLSIAGTDGPGMVYLESVSVKHNVSEYIYFIGAIDEAEKYRLFISEDAYLQISTHEGFGLAAAEAFFSGMLVVHSNQGGLRDVIGSRGIIISPESIELDDVNEILNFVANLNSFSRDDDFIVRNISNYSLTSRANAFLGAYVV